MKGFQTHPSSYRDPSGYVFYVGDTLYRQVNNSYKESFDQFQQQGLASHLINSEKLIPHEILAQNFSGDSDWYTTLKPEVVPFVSYPYEWCFEMLKDAALATLSIAKEAIDFKMHLKDASAFNLQWHNGRMVFIDTLSFELYDQNKPWIAYRQFCEHFLAPLALMHYLKEPIQPLQLAYPDGIPLTLAQKCLPFKSKWNLHIFLHLHLGSKMAAKVSNSQKTEKPFSKTKMLHLLQSLEDVISTFNLDRQSSEWSGYYKEAFQRHDYVQQKKTCIETWLSDLNIQTAFDAGANEGEFSFLLANRGVYTISTDLDHFSINQLYKKVKRKGLTNIHPLLLDLSNPTPAIGFSNSERTSFTQRTKTDLVLALALIHHLAIGKNIGFDKIAAWFNSLGRYLFIEFVPKQDEKIIAMLQSKKDSYEWYTQQNFEQLFSRHYQIVKKNEIGTSGRTLYLMESIKVEN